MKNRNGSTHFQAILLLFIVSTLVFLSSFISLNHSTVQITHESDGKSKTLQRKKFQVEKRPTLSKVPVVVKRKEDLTKRNETSKCLINFRPKCAIHPYVHYWNEFTDCFSSPLRKMGGLKAPIKDQKFVVFQPDGGGWNNIRMALEVVVLFAKVTGRILVLPPDAVLYLLILNKKWGSNKSNVDVYFDFDRMKAFDGLETMTMEAFLERIAKPGLLNIPLPNNDITLNKRPLWDYLNQACYVRIWQPKDAFIALNLTDDKNHNYIGSYDYLPPDRLKSYILKPPRVMMEYNQSFHDARAIYFPGSEKNRLLTHFYSYLFFPNMAYDHLTKRFMRDRFRYHDEIFCTASKILQKLYLLQNVPIHENLSDYLSRYNSPDYYPSASNNQQGNKKYDLPLNYFHKKEIITNSPKFIAFHIRRGDFQQKFTRLPAEKILSLTKHLIDKPKEKIVYISTDENDRSFFEPFIKQFRQIYFLSDLIPNTGIEEINQNFIGMIEQVICVSADMFIGTPLSTFTAYITRMRGYLNRTIQIPVYEDENSLRGDAPVKEWLTVDRKGVYEKTFYFMKHHMYQLHQKPRFNFPLWVRDFVDPFKDIDDA